MYRRVDSKIFAEKLRERDPAEITDIEKAIKRVLVDPTLHQYIRWYISPYKQEHPTDKTITIFFEVNTADQYVFFVWINDPSCPHDTHQSYGADPCIQEFGRIRSNPGHEAYSKDYHEGKFGAIPRAPNLPRFLSFEKYGTKVYCNVLDNGSTYYSLSVETDANDEDDLFDHYQKLLAELAKHFKALNQAFEFQLLTNSFPGLIQIFQQVIDRTQWDESTDQDQTIFRLR